MKNLLIGFLVILGLSFAVYGCNSVAQNISSDQKLYSSNCASCHILIEPSAFKKDVWELYVHKYGKQLSDKKKQILVDYLAGHKQEYK